MVTRRGLVTLLLAPLGLGLLAGRAQAQSITRLFMGLAIPQTVVTPARFAESSIVALHGVIRVA